MEVTQHWQQPPTLPIHTNTNQGSRHEHKHMHQFCEQRILHILLSDAGMFKTCYQLHASFPFPPQKPEKKRKEGQPTQRSELTQTEPGWCWLSCTQGNVMTKQHIPQFSGGRGKPPGRGASLQCRAHGAMKTPWGQSIPPPSGPQPHLLNWSTLQVCAASWSNTQHYFSLYSEVLKCMTFTKIFHRLCQTICILQ